MTRFGDKSHVRAIFTALIPVIVCNTVNKSLDVLRATNKMDQCEYCDGYYITIFSQ